MAKAPTLITSTNTLYTNREVGVWINIWKPNSFSDRFTSSHEPSLFLAGQPPAAVSNTVTLSFSVPPGHPPTFSLQPHLKAFWLLVSLTEESLAALTFSAVPLVTSYIQFMSYLRWHYQMQCQGTGSWGHSHQPEVTSGNSNCLFPRRPTLSLFISCMTARGGGECGGSLAMSAKKKKGVLCFPNEDKFQTLLTLHVF